jgi:uncharacterized tellurite resistance protein B-like protein
MGWQHFLGGSVPRAGGDAASSDPRDTETVRRIVGQLEALPRDRARFLAAFAYILTRVAAADLDISDVEEGAIESLIAEHGNLPEAQAILVAEMARNQALLVGGTEDYLVTRQFKELSTDAERLDLLRCAYLVGAADDEISLEESDTLQDIAFELDVDRHAVNAIRDEFAPKLSAIKLLNRMREERAGS